MNRRIIITAIPIVGVNLTAIWAQFEFWASHLPQFGTAGQALFALSIESVSVMLCYFAHLSMVSADSSFKLRAGAILFALIVATLNGSHYLTPAGSVTAASVGVFACSAMSPILWGVYSKRQARDTLIENGLIEGQSVRLGSARWFFHPRKSWQVFSLAVWSGENNPQAAIREYENRAAEIRPGESAPPETAEPAALPASEPAALPAAPQSPAPQEPAPQPAARARRSARPRSTAGKPNAAQAIREAVKAAPAGASAGDIAAGLEAQGITVTAAHVRAVRSAAQRAESAARRAGIRAVDTAAGREGI
jgi:hypothetical protein